MLEQARSLPGCLCVCVCFRLRGGKGGEGKGALWAAPRREARASISRVSQALSSLTSALESHASRAGEPRKEVWRGQVWLRVPWGVEETTCAHTRQDSCLYTRPNKETNQPCTSTDRPHSNGPTDSSSCYWPCSLSPSLHSCCTKTSALS